MERDFFAMLQRDAARAGLPFLVVGGHAVNAYGYQRTTLDADLVIDAEQASLWRTFWEEHGYMCVHATDAFLQFNARAPAGQFPVDLMLVSPRTFRTLHARMQQRAIGAALLDVPAPLDLIAMKLHAARYRSSSAREKDVQDIVGLVRGCGIDPRGVEFTRVVAQFGDETIRIQLEARFAGR